jgi:4-hydroxy-tetrahydrodipicolinate synthase
MKEALVLLGKLEQAIVRPPLMKLSDKEINNIKLALIKSNMLN